MIAKIAIRIGAFLFIMAAITVMVIEPPQNEKPSPQTLFSPPPERAAPTNPLRETLARCSRLGEIAGRDAECLAAWAENRHRFFLRGGR